MFAGLASLVSVAFLLDICLADTKPKSPPYNLLPFNFTLGCNLPETPNDLVVGLFSDQNCTTSLINMTFESNGKVQNFTAGFLSYKLLRKLNDHEYLNFMVNGTARGTYKDIGSNWLAIGEYPWECATRTNSLTSDNQYNVADQCLQAVSNSTTGKPPAPWTCAVVQYDSQCANPINPPERHNCTDKDADPERCAKIHEFYPSLLSSDQTGNLSARSIHNLDSRQSYVMEMD